MIQITLPDDFIAFKRWELVNKRYEIEVEARNKGVYVLRDHNDNVLYVGKSFQLYKRLKDHIAGRGPSEAFCHLIDNIIVYFVADDYEVDIYESYVINLLKPKFNKDKVFYRKNDNLYDLYRVQYDEVCELIDYLTDKRDELKEERRNLSPAFDVDDTIVDDMEQSQYLLGELLRLNEKIDELDEKLANLRYKRRRLSILLDD